LGRNPPVVGASTTAHGSGHNRGGRAGATPATGLAKVVVGNQSNVARAAHTIATLGGCVRINGINITVVVIGVDAGLDPRQSPIAIAGICLHKGTRVLG